MARPQSGNLAAPRSASTLLLMEAPEMGLNAGSVSKAAAVIPALTHDIASAHPDSQIASAVGFGSMLWSLIWQGNRPLGLRSRKTIFPPACDEPEIEGDLLVFVTSENAEVNGLLVDRVKEKLGYSVEVLEEVVATRATAVDAGDSAPPHWVGSGDTEYMNSSFWLVRSMECDDEENLQAFAPCDPDAPVRGFILHRPERNRVDHVALSCDALAFNRLIPPEDSGLDFIRCGYYVVPSLDLLVGLRLGGIRMGTLSPTHPYKE